MTKEFALQCLNGAYGNAHDKTCDILTPQRSKNMLNDLKRATIKILEQIYESKECELLERPHNVADGNFDCSNCNGTIMYGVFKYCPNCGAKIRR